MVSQRDRCQTSVSQRRAALLRCYPAQYRSAKGFRRLGFAVKRRQQMRVCMVELIHMTAAYSNALLVAILPHISGFAAKLDLPVKQPITFSDVTSSSPSPYKGLIADAVLLTNNYWFLF